MTTTTSPAGHVRRTVARLRRADLDKVRTRSRQLLKHTRLRIRPARPAPHPLLHVVGCQRSGTTMLTELLDHDERIRVFGELGSLFDDVPRHHRLRDRDDVVRQLDRSGAACNVVKPLVESHRVDELLGLADGAVAIWMIRHYQDVAASNLKRFGARNGIDNLRPIVLDDPDDWRNAGLSAATRHTVRELFDESMPLHDAAALFWYCRNTLWFEQDLAHDDRIRTCRYETLVADPAATLAAIYGWCGLGTPPAAAARTVHRTSVGKGADVAIAPTIADLCDRMWTDLLAADAEHGVTVRP